MLIEERIDDINWTANEKIVIEFIRNKQENISKLEGFTKAQVLENRLM